MSREYSLQHYLEKAATYCAYQERSEADLRKRLHQWELKESEIEKIVEKVRTENFFDDARFAAAYVRGKHRQNKWGKYKIRQGLAAHGISSEIMADALNDFSSEIYYDTLLSLVKSRLSKVAPAELDTFKTKGQTFNYLRSKGYESDLIQAAWQEARSALE